jgi:hypothetical protein
MFEEGRKAERRLTVSGGAVPCLIVSGRNGI